MRKSQLTGLLLTFFFGPLGLFYSSVSAALAFTLATLVFGAMTAGLGALLIWPISIIIGFFTVHSYNQKVALEERRHQELLQATKQKTVWPMTGQDLNGD